MGLTHLDRFLVWTYVLLHCSKPIIGHQTLAYLSSHLFTWNSPNLPTYLPISLMTLVLYLSLFFALFSQLLAPLLSFKCLSEVWLSHLTFFCHLKDLGLTCRSAWLKRAQFCGSLVNWLTFAIQAKFGQKNMSRLMLKTLHNLGSLIGMKAGPWCKNQCVRPTFRLIYNWGQGFRFMDFRPADPLTP